MAKMIPARIQGLPGTKDMSQAYYAISPGSPLWSDRDYVTLAREGYKLNPTVFACINLICNAIAGIPIQIKREDSNGKLVPAKNPELKKLLNRPNHKQSGAQYIAAHFGQYLIGGNNYNAMTGFPLDPAKPIKRFPYEMFLLRPDRVSIMPRNYLGEVVSYRFDVGGGNYEYWDDSRVIHRKAFNPIDDFYGQSPLDAGARDVDIANQASTFNFALLQNFGRPSGMLVSKSRIGDDQFRKLQEDVEKRFTGPFNAGRILVINGSDAQGGFEWAQMAINAKDGEFIEVKKLSKIEICNVFGVPAEMVGVTEQKTYSNYKEARSSFYQEIILPMFDRYCDDMFPLLALIDDTLKLGYDRENIEALQEDRQQVWTRGLAATASGDITNNEFRKSVGLEPSTDAAANTRLIPMGKLTPDEVMAGGGGTGDGAQDPAAGAQEADPEKDPAGDARPGKAYDVKALSPLYAAGLKTKSQRQTYWKDFDRRRMGWIVAFQKQYKALLAKDFKEISDIYRKHGEGAALSHKTTDAWKALLHKNWRAVGMDFAGKVDQGLRETLGKSHGERETKAKDAQQARWEQSVTDRINKQGGRHITKIETTTRKKVALTISDGVEEGKNQDQIADDIAEVGAFSDGRATNISRTEVMGASNFGSDMAARSFEIPLDKVWIDTADDRTRETHQEADGQTVGLDEYFEVGGQKLMFPADDSGGASADEIVNCRCTQGYQPSEGA